MINIEYEKYVGYVLGIHHNGRKMLKGKFKEKGGKRIITEELKCLRRRLNAKKKKKDI